VKGLDAAVGANDLDGLAVPIDQDARDLVGVDECFAGRWLAAKGIVRLVLPSRFPGAIFWEAFQQNI
jgi:hypothetical protein